MTYVLTVSSQGQVIIPVKMRKHLGISAGSKIVLRAELNGKIPVAMIEPSSSWAKRVSGIAKGVYGKAEDYVEVEREKWGK